jgi:uncharacterized protein YbcI
LGAHKREGQEGATTVSPAHLAVEAGDQSNPLLEISNAMVGIFKEQFGRGPSHVRTFWAGQDTITVILEETFTPAERNMVKRGEHQRLRDTRLFFQVATTAELCAPVERLTGRKVRAFASGTDTHIEGLSVETFVLHPRGYVGTSRADIVEG